MAARRLIVAMIVLLVLSSVAAALVPVDSRTDVSSTETETETTLDRPGPSGELHRETLRAGANLRAGAKPDRIVIKLGDQLVLRVSSPVPEEVEIPALGEIAPVDPDAPAHFDLLPFEAGRYPVRLVDARRTVGVIVVEPRRRERKRDSGSDQPGGSSTDSPGSSTTARTPAPRSAT
jgi:hypothetical protein